MFALELELESHLKQPACPGIARVKAVPESRRDLIRAGTLLDDGFGSFEHRAAGSNEAESRIVEPPAGLLVAAMMGTERQNSGKLCDASTAFLKMPVTNSIRPVVKFASPSGRSPRRSRSRK